jgi:hypothetical protein
MDARAREGAAAFHSLRNRDGLLLDLLFGFIESGFVGASVGAKQNSGRLAAVSY